MAGSRKGRGGKTPRRTVPRRKNSGRPVGAPGKREMRSTGRRQASAKPASDAAYLREAIDGLGLPGPFPEEALAQAGAFPEVDPEKALARGRRRDLRPRTHVTIDGEDARDFDDAVSAEKQGDGYRVWVSIADVAWYVKARSPLDREALLRGTSVYLPGRVLPMLPERLSNGLCSLLPGEARLTVTCEMVVDGDGGRGSIEIYPSLIRSAARLTYTQVQARIDGAPDALPEAVAGVVQDCIEASRLLRRRRFEKGSLDLEIPEPEVLFDKGGNPANVVARNPLPAHQVIEDLMVAANESVAEHLLDLGLEGVYRVHPPPPREKWQRMAAWAKRFGHPVRTGKENSPKAVAGLLARLKQSRQSESGQMLLLRSLSQAFYSAEVDLHFGLASEAYAHFTSPIRRYPDLLVHRALWNHWLKKPNLRRLEAAAENSSEAERRAIEAEREIVQAAACLVARRHLGEEMPARVTGVHAAGLFVRPEGLFAEGLVPVRSLGERSGDYFEVWEEALALVGRRTRAAYTLGDRLTVRLAEVDLERRRINFELAAPEAASPGKSAAAGKGAGRRKAARGQGAGKGRGRGDRPGRGRKR